MKRGEEEFSERRVIIFLLGAILISLVSTGTVLITLSEVTKNKNLPETEPQAELPQGNGGLVSLTILERSNRTNGTQ